MKTFKCDLHVHSSHSNKPNYWALRKFNCPESYTSPAHIYKTAVQRGMDFVTISDHNSISGALEIAHLPNTFISSEITSHFPENGCKVHVVISDVSESGFSETLRLRKNIYELLAYLNHEKIAHFLAHPLYSQNDKLTFEIVEKSLLLFKVFEAKNGCRAKRFNQFTKELVSSLTPVLIERLANKYDISPYGENPWLKGMTGGSDDHGGLFIARAYTSSKTGKTVKDFVSAIRDRKTWADGEDGGPLTMAHSLYGVAQSYYKERFGERRRDSTPFVGALLDRFFNVGTDKSSFVEKIRLFVLKNMPEKEVGRIKNFEELLDSEARRLLNDQQFLSKMKDLDLDHKVFMVTSRLANRTLYHYTTRLMNLTMNSGFFEYLNAAGGIGLVHLLITPYYLAFHHQHKGKELIYDIIRQTPEIRFDSSSEKIALFTDTLDEINGVAITIKRLIKTAQSRGVELTVITSGNQDDKEVTGVKQFKSVGDFLLPEYPELRMSFPPILDVMDYIEKEGITHIHISTPGTVGILGLLIGRLMDIPVAGTYHTDIPQYVRTLTNDEFLEQVAWNYMIWFYNQMEEVMVPSAGTREQLHSHGLPLDKMRPLPRWVDPEQFKPEKRNENFWIERGISNNLKLLYVGRVSREKSLELLVKAFCLLVDEGHDLSLAIIGDGPYRADMEKALAGYPVTFTGFLQGEELQTGYASADLFVFPSSTDTFGNVVLEAQSSGLPVIVSDEGGPRELMIEGETGLVFKAEKSEELIAELRKIVKNPAMLAEMRQNARTFILENAPDAIDTYSTILRTGTQTSNQTSSSFSDLSNCRFLRAD